MENMEYYTQRLQCSDAEKDACLETVAKVYQLRGYLRQNGFLAAEVLAEEESDPFFRICLLEFAELYLDPDGLEQLFTRYLMAGNYRGGAFLNAVLISRGLVMLARGWNDGNYFGTTDPGIPQRDWYDAISEGLRGYFGIAYREKVREAIRQADRAGRPEQEYSSLLPEFDDLIELTPQQRDWLVRHVSSSTLCRALKLGGSAVYEFLMEGAEDREALEKDFSNTCNVRKIDVMAAQRAILAKAANLVQSDAGII